MLHALGITHVVSVGHSADVTLSIEEREGRIKVLDIKDINDDGASSLRSHFGPIYDWIEKARQESGTVCAFFSLCQSFS